MLPVDRRHRRRQETIEELLDVAVRLMAEEGAGGLSLGEVARRMGIKTPSLYVYFASKNALYDAIFERGWTAALGIVRAQEQAVAAADDPAAALLGAVRDFVRWAVENPAYAQLMFWRPVPGYEPSPTAYAPAVEVVDRLVAAFETLRKRGVIAADADVREAARAWTAMVSGVISQHLANAPADSFEDGEYTRLLPLLVSMFLAHYSVGSRQAANPREKGSADGRTDNARNSSASKGNPVARQAPRGGDGGQPERRAARSAARPRRG